MNIKSVNNNGKPLNETSRRLKLPAVVKAFMHCSHAMWFFVAVWVWASCWYGDVLVMAREYSFFAFDKLLMKPVWEQTYGSLWIAGRALLNLFAFPWLGGLVLSLLLTVISWLVGYLLRVPARWRWLQYVPAAVYIYVVTWMGFDAFVFREPGWLLGIPLCVAVILILQVVFLRSFSHRRLAWIWKCREDETVSINALLVAVALLIPAGAAVYGSAGRSDVRLTAKLQRLMREQKWDEMAHAAEAWNGSSRQVAAYHALALVRNGRLLDDLFKVRYDFRPVHLVSRKGEPSMGREIYEADCNFHAGLIMSAYRNDMEQMTFDGIGTARLRRMIRYALLRHETNLALRYLLVLSKQPFEGDYVAYYRKLASNPDLVETDSELKAIGDMLPVEDQFEGSFVRPLFIGYYLGTKNIRSRGAYDVATAASLYARMMPLFCYRAVAYAKEGSYPPVVADAMGMLKVMQPEAVSAFSGIDMNAGRYVGFAKAFTGTDTLAVYQRAVGQFKNYSGYYPYYYFFGHPDVSDKSVKEEQEKGGIN